MTTIEFYFDPVCPFAWAASRWLINTNQRRDFDIDWRQMSLAVLNEGAEVPDKQRHHLEVSQRLGRVLAAARSQADNSVLGPLYTALGHRVHEQGASVTADIVRTALTEGGSDPRFAAAMDDETFDHAVRAAHQESQERLGDAGGSPITCIDGQCFFGPVLTAIPDNPDGDRLFDALQTIATTAAFAQIQRPHNGPPTFTDD